MPFQIKIAARDKLDMRTTIDWLRKRSPEAAANWYSLLHAKLQTLEDLPDRFPLAEEAVDLNIPMRELLIGKRRGVYRILFTVHTDHVQVLRIRHAMRDLLTLDDL